MLSRLLHCVPRCFAIPLAFSIVSVFSGCSEPKYGDQLAKAYPVRSDFLVANTPKVAASGPYELGSPPLAGLELPENLRSGDQKALQAEVDAKNILDTKKLETEVRQVFQKSLDECFGTPADPKIPGDDSLLAKLEITDEQLKIGSKLYQSNCLQCHGLTGNGNGPGGKYLFPMPRDYRQGLFKFITTDPRPEGTKPQREDLYRTIYKGLPGSGMTSFAGLTAKEINAIISYIIHLSIRGETEYQVMKLALKSGLEAEDIAIEIKSEAKKITKVWADSQKRLIPIDEDPYKTPERQLEAASRGYKHFLDGNVGACTTCHVNFGKNAIYQYDSWGTIVRPRNLTVPIYRAGGEAKDLYARVYGGVHGSGMPSHQHLLPKAGDAPNTHKLWEIIHFVRTVATQEGRDALAEKYQIQWD